MSDKYILDANGEPIPARNLMEWANWFEGGHNQRIVKQEMVGDVKISTVFLSLNHNYEQDGPPILWETMTFKDGDENDQDRCSGSREQAMAMHERMVEKVKARVLDAK